VEVGLPLAAAVNVAVVPTTTVAAVGCSVITGGAVAGPGCLMPVWVTGGLEVKLSKPIEALGSARSSRPSSRGW
jgi:hypothetical protein